YTEGIMSYGSIGASQTSAAGDFGLLSGPSGATYHATAVDSTKHSVAMLVASGTAPVMLYVNRIPFTGSLSTAFDGTFRVGRYISTVFGGLNVLDVGLFSEALTDAQALAAYQDLKAMYPTQVQ